MLSLLRDWLVDNPFLLFDLRRWRKRGFLWKLPLWCAGLPALVILLLHLVYATGGPWIQGAIKGSLGLIAFSLLAALHVIMAAVFAVNALGLGTEAGAGRLEFLRLIPMPRHELMVRIGLARAVLRLPAALVALPLYGVVMAYGGVPAEDVAALYLLFFAFLFAPPGNVEISSALTTLGKDGSAAGKSAKPDAGNMLLGWVLWAGVQVLAQALMKPVLIPLFTTVWRRLTTALGPDLGPMMPLTAMAATARLLWYPQPWYGVVLSPFWLLGVWWALRCIGNTMEAAELWSREPLVETGPGARTSVTLPEESGRPGERRHAVRIGALSTFLFALVLVGYAWQPLVLSGALSNLTGSTTPAGGVAGILTLLGMLAFLPVFEGARLGRLEPLGARELFLRRIAAPAASALGWTAAIVFTASLLGGLVPDKEVLSALFRLTAAGFAAAVFAVGWASLRDGLKLRVRSGKAWQRLVLLAVVLWIATYVLPAVVMMRGLPSLGWHLAAAWSPVYAFLRLLPAAWKSAPPLPFWPAALLPVLLGAPLLALRPREEVKDQEKEERAGPDRLESMLLGFAERWENPLFSQALHRQVRRSPGLFAATLASVVAGIVVLVVLGGSLTYAVVGISGASVYDLLYRPTRAAGLSLAAAVSLGMAAAITWLGLLPVGFSVNSAIGQENTTGRQQQRMPFLLVTALTDWQIVSGLLAGGTITSLPALALVLTVAPIGLVLSVATGAPWWLVPLWLVWTLVAVALAVHTAVAAFHDWPGRRGCLRTGLNLCYGIVIGVYPFGLFIFLAAAVISGFLPLIQAGVVLIFVTLLVAAGTLPLAVRGAERAVHAARMEDDLERKK